MRPPRGDITMPELPPKAAWINVPFLRMSTLLGRSVPLVWFWDSSSLNSLRALPYLLEWDRRYSEAGLRVIGVHSPQFDFGERREVVEEAVRRLGISFAVVLDPSFEIWRIYGNEVWPALYLWDRRGLLRYYHFGEGGYRDTERAIGELLREIDEQLDLPEPMAPLRDTDAPDALVKAPTPHVYLGPDRSAKLMAAGEELSVNYEGAAAAAVIDGAGELEVVLDGKPAGTIPLDGPRLYELVDSGVHEAHELRLRFREEARAYALSFAAGPA